MALGSSRKKKKDGKRSPGGLTRTGASKTTGNRTSIKTDKGEGQLYNAKSGQGTGSGDRMPLNLSLGTSGQSNGTSGQSRTMSERSSQQSLGSMAAQMGGGRTALGYNARMRNKDERRRKERESKRAARKAATRASRQQKYGAQLAKQRGRADGAPKGGLGTARQFTSGSAIYSPSGQYMGQSGVGRRPAAGGGSNMMLGGNSMIGAGGQFLPGTAGTRSPGQARTAGANFNEQRIRQQKQDLQLEFINNMRKNMSSMSPFKRKFWTKRLANMEYI